ncbi:MAG TPA: Tol-Pal system beta propeller repeat protein TolB [Myxococcota bacterium]
MLRFALVCALLSTHALAALAQGPVVGDVEGGEFRPFPLAVAATRLGDGAAGKNAQADQLATVIRNDLDMSGAFQLLDKKGFIDTDGLDTAEVRFDDWRNVSAQGLVKTRLGVSGADIVVDVWAYDVGSQKQVLKKQVKLPAADVRAAGHQIADDVFRAFTGEPGVFRTRLAVVKKVQGEKHVFVMDIDGEGVRQVTKGGSLNLLPSWAPDGRSLLFTSYRYENPDLFEIGVNGGEVKPISRRPGLNTGGRFSPDGSKIAVTLSQDGNSEIYILARNGDVLKRLTNQWGIDTSPSWSPDGTQIAFVSSRSGHPDLYIVDAGGAGQPRRITFQGTYNQTPAWSPRGTHIAFTARDERNVFDIFVLNVKTNEIKRVTQGMGNNEEPSFSPNGRLLVFTTTRNKARQLVVSNIDGTKQTVLPSLGDHTSPQWGPFVR